MFDAALLLTTDAPGGKVDPCPSDPWGNAFAWMLCDMVKAFGVDTTNLRTDLVAGYLNGKTSRGACAGLFESITAHTCVTETLWNVTEVAGLSLGVVMIVARFMRLLADNNYSVSVSWAFANPILRFVVFLPIEQLSFPIMVQVHAVSTWLAGLIYLDITNAGGGSASPGLLLNAAVILVIQYLYGVVIYTMAMASLMAYQICIVLAPLLIPLWVYGPDAGLFRWFGRTVVGGLVAPIFIAAGWATVIVIVHQFDQNVGSIIQPLILTVGIWFLAKLLAATSLELFRSTGAISMLQSVFFAESAMSGSLRLAGGLITPRWRERFASKVIGMSVDKDRGGWLPFTHWHGHYYVPEAMARSARNIALQQRQYAASVFAAASRNGNARRALVGAMDPQRIKDAGSLALLDIQTKDRAGDFKGMAQTIAMLEFGGEEALGMLAAQMANLPDQVQLADFLVANSTVGGIRANRRLEGLGQDTMTEFMRPGSVRGNEFRRYRRFSQAVNAPSGFVIPEGFRAQPYSDTLPKHDGPGGYWLDSPWRGIRDPATPRRESWLRRHIGWKERRPGVPLAGTPATVRDPYDGTLP
jgi:hypothetical protein